MIEAVNEMKRNLETALPYGKERIDERLEKKSKRITKVERGSFYLIRNVITAPMYKMARAAGASD